MKRPTLTSLTDFILAAALGPATSSQQVFRPDCELPIRNAEAAGRFERQCGEDGVSRAPAVMASKSSRPGRSTPPYRRGPRC